MEEHANIDFETKIQFYEDDNSVLRYRQRWDRQRRGDTKGTRELLRALLTTDDVDADNVEKLLAEDIHYRDLASLSHKDLELMGFKGYKRREELLKFFAQLPNQDPSYDDICHLKEALGYNCEIMRQASSHLEAMRSSLAAGNYKLQISPPTDVIVGDKSFVSRFVLEALDELMDVTEDIEKQLNELKTTTLNISNNQPYVRTNRKRMFVKTSLLVMGSVSSFAILYALYYWKFRN